MQKIALGSYQLTPAEGCRITVAAHGTGASIKAALDGTSIPVVNGSPIIIKPEQLNGHGAFHRLEIHPFFTEESTKEATYTIVVADQDDKQFDTIVKRIDTSRELPYDARTPIDLWVEL